MPESYILFTIAWTHLSHDDLRALHLAGDSRFSLVSPSPLFT